MCEEETKEMDRWGKVRDCSWGAQGEETDRWDLSGAL